MEVSSKFGGNKKMESSYFGAAVDSRMKGGEGG